MDRNFFRKFIPSIFVAAIFVLLPANSPTPAQESTPASEAETQDADPLNSPKLSSALRFALLPDRALPPYAYLPGQTPHPTRDHDGHSFAVEPDAPDAPAPPDAENWRSCHDYLYGIDLFNYGYCW